MGYLDDKVIVITGGARGIGLAVARACLTEGARVVLNDLGCDEEGRGADPSVVEAAAEALGSSAGRLVTDARDASDPGTAKPLVATAISTFGRLDGVVSCAGHKRDRSLLRLSEEDLDAMLGVFVRGPFALFREASRAMIDAKNPGSLVVMTAQQAFFGSARQSSFGAAAAAAVGLTRSAALELRRHNIRVNAVAPTARTRQTETLPLFQGIASDSMMPEQIAPVVVFLLAKLSNEVSGQVFGVAGRRIYMLRSRETSGWLYEGNLDASRVAEHFQEISAK